MPDICQFKQYILFLYLKFVHGKMHNQTVSSNQTTSWNKIKSVQHD